MGKPLSKTQVEAVIALWRSAWPVAEIQQECLARHNFSISRANVYRIINQELAATGEQTLGEAKRRGRVRRAVTLRLEEKKRIDMLQRHARARGTNAYELLRDIVRAVIDGDLVDAVLEPRP
jgi:hypothetical protein